MDVAINEHAFSDLPHQFWSHQDWYLEEAENARQYAKTNLHGLLMLPCKLQALWNGWTTVSRELLQLVPFQP